MPRLAASFRHSFRWRCQWGHGSDGADVALCDRGAALEGAGGEEHRLLDVEGKALLYVR